MSLRNMGDHWYRSIPSLSYLSIAIILGNDCEMVFVSSSPVLNVEQSLLQTDYRPMLERSVYPVI